MNTLQDVSEDRLDPEHVAAIIASARRKPIDSRLPPQLWVQLAHLRQNFAGEVYAVACLEGRRRAIVLLVPTRKDDAPPPGDWPRVDAPHFLMLEAASRDPLAH